MSSRDQTNLHGLLEAIEKIEGYVHSFKTGDELYANAVYFDAVLMNFVVIGEMVDRLSESLKQKYPEIAWLKIKGFRNIIAHNYFGIDAEEVWEIAPLHLIQFKKQILFLLKKADS